jgi:hypothetical protein
MAIDGVWRSGKRLVVRVGAQLPDRCVKTNEPVNGQWVELRLSWHHPVLYLVLFVNIIVYLIVANFLSKSVTLKVGISDRALASRRNAIAITWALVVGGVALVVAGSLNQSAVPFLMGLLAMPFAAAVYLWGVKLVTPTRIEDGYVWIAGVHPDYLALLPEWPGYPPDPGSSV